MHAEAARQVAGAGKTVAGLEIATEDSQGNLGHKLTVDGDFTVWGKPKPHIDLASCRRGRTRNRHLIFQIWCGTRKRHLRRGVAGRVLRPASERSDAPVIVPAIPAPGFVLCGLATPQKSWRSLSNI